MHIMHRGSWPNTLSAAYSITALLFPPQDYIWNNIPLKNALKFSTTVESVDISVFQGNHQESEATQVVVVGVAHCEG